MRDLMRDIVKDFRRPPVHAQVMHINFGCAQILMAQNFCL